MARKPGALTAPFAAYAARGSETEAFLHDVIDGLSATPKRIPPKYFYDSEGSRLFEDITQTREYYPTRSEHEILRLQAGAIVQHFPTGAALVEFGSGACIKVRFLLDAARKLKAYVPVDIAGDFLATEAAALAQGLPQSRRSAGGGGFHEAVRIAGRSRGPAEDRLFPGLDHRQFRAA